MRAHSQAIQVFALVLLATFSLGIENRSKETPKSSSGNLIGLKDAAEHWIGYPKSPYAQKTSTLRPPPTTSTKAPASTRSQSRTINYKNKRRKKKIEYGNDDLEPEHSYPQYAETSRDDPSFYMDEAEEESEEDYDDAYYSRPRRRPKSKFSMSVSPSPSNYPSSHDFLTSSSFNNVFTPKIAQYVVHDPKKYHVRRIQPQAIFTVKPTFDKDMHQSASSSAGRRLDPPDYDDRENFSGFGPQNSFPPRQVLDKIASPGDRQPCHGPECHQHHKGLVRFYWKRVIYPNDEFGRQIRPFRNRNRNRGRRRRRRRRPRDRIRSPSTHQELYAPDSDDYPLHDDDDEKDDDADEDQDETEQNAKRHDMWLPGRAYGHDLDEGSNYSNNEKKVYRDKRYAYRQWQRQKKYQEYIRKNTK